MLSGHELVISFAVARQHIVGQEVLVGQAVVRVGVVEAFEHLRGHVVAEVEISGQVFLVGTLSQASVFGMFGYRLLVAQQRQRLIGPATVEEGLLQRREVFAL